MRERDAVAAASRVGVVYRAQVFGLPDAHFVTVEGTKQHCWEWRPDGPHCLVRQPDVEDRRELGEMAAMQAARAKDWLLRATLRANSRGVH